MIEQEMASIIKFILDNANNPSPYYYNVPQNFVVPAVYFPVPEIVTGGETFLTYNMDYSWYIVFFHKTTQGAYVLAHQTLSAIRAAKNLIPIIKSDGNIDDNNWVRVNDPTIKEVDSGAVQLAVSWRSRRPYNSASEDITQAQSFNVGVYMKSGKSISDAYADVLKSFSEVINTDGEQGG